MKRAIGFIISSSIVFSLCACGTHPAVEQKTEGGAAADKTEKVEKVIRAPVT